MKKTTGPMPYTAPQCAVESFGYPGILCTSPAQGTNEEIEYDDWKDLIS